VRFGLWLEVFESIQFVNNYEDSYKGQHNFTLAAYNGKPQPDHANVLGYVEYSEFDDEVYVNYIFVGEKFRRQSVATALMNELKRLYPGTKIHIGMTTPEGSELFKSLED